MSLFKLRKLINHERNTTVRGAVKEDWDPGSAKLRLQHLSIYYNCVQIYLYMYILVVTYVCYVLGCSALFVWVKYVDIPSLLTNEFKRIKLYKRKCFLYKFKLILIKSVAPIVKDDRRLPVLPVL